MTNNDPNSNIKKHSLNGFIWTLVGSGGQQVFSFLIFLILARTLGAKDFGLVAMASVFIDLLMLASRAGLTEVVIQKSNISKLEKNTAFWSSFVLGLFFSAGLFLLSTTLAQILHQPSLKQVIQWLAFLPLINALGTVQEGLIRKEFGFKALAFRNIFANIVSGIIAVIMALKGFGVLSLIMQRVVSGLLLTGILWWNSDWKPEFSFSLKKSIDQLKFGSTLALSSILASGNQRVIDLIVGYFLGPVALGYLRIAWRGIDLMLEFSIRPISNITLSTFSALSKNTDQLSRVYIRISQLTMLIAVPIFIGSALVAPELIKLLFGSQWEQSIIPMQILSLSVLTFPIIYFKNNVLIAAGESKAVLNLNVIEFLLSFIVILVSAQFGLIGAALGNVIRVLLITPVILFSLSKRINLNIRALITKLLPVINATIWMAICLSVTRELLYELVNPITLTLVQIGEGMVIYIFVLIKLHNQYIFELIDSFYKVGKHKKLLDKLRN